MDTQKKLSLQELTQQSEALLKQAVPLKQIKEKMLAAGYSTLTYEAVERILYAKNLVPLSKWQKLKKDIYEKIGVVSIDPRKKVQVFISILIFLVLMVYFIAIFRNLEKGPFYAFTHNPLTLAFQIRTNASSDLVVVNYGLVPKLDKTLTGFDSDLEVVPQKKLTDISDHEAKDTSSTINIDGYTVVDKKFFDVAEFENDWKMFTLLVQTYLSDNQAVITAGKFQLEPNTKRVKYARLEAQTAEKQWLVFFDETTKQDILFLAKDGKPVRDIKKLIPLYSYLRNIELAVSNELFAQGETVFELFPEQKTSIQFDVEGFEGSELNIAYDFFNDPVTNQEQVSFASLAFVSNGLFVEDYPVKRRRPVPVVVSPESETDKKESLPVDGEVIAEENTVEVSKDESEIDVDVVGEEAEESDEVVIESEPNNESNSDETESVSTEDLSTDENSETSTPVDTTETVAETPLQTETTEEGESEPKEASLSETVETAQTKEPEKVYNDTKSDENESEMEKAAEEDLVESEKKIEEKDTNVPDDSTTVDVSNQGERSDTVTESDEKILDSAVEPVAEMTEVDNEEKESVSDVVIESESQKDVPETTEKNVSEPSKTASEDEKSANTETVPSRLNSVSVGAGETVEVSAQALHFLQEVGS